MGKKLRNAVQPQRTEQHPVLSTVVVGSMLSEKGAPGEPWQGHLMLVQPENPGSSVSSSPAAFCGYCFCHLLGVQKKDSDDVGQLTTVCDLTPKTE